jgi:tetratricopeptide (TPR) repeat protein
LTSEGFMQRCLCCIAVMLPWVVACASRGPSPVVLAEIGRAEGAIREGCYRCLEEALSTFGRLAAGPAAPPAARRGAFEAALLLSLRAKELGLNAAPFASRAGELAQLIRATDPMAMPPAAYLEAAELVTGELSGLDSEMRQQRMRRPRPRADLEPLPARAAIETARPSDLVAEYLALAMDCEEPVGRPEIRFDDVRMRHGDAPIIRYRLGICGRSSLLPPLRQADARWTDTFFFEGRQEMATRPVADVAKAAELFALARSEFPESDAITLALATARNALSEYEPALKLYELVLRDQPTHRDALLGKVLSLSYLNRYTEAIATATRMIDLGTWHVGDAYYWRAWNRYHIYALESGWADIERATSLLVNTNVYTLAGFIAYARKELDTAIDRFDRAFAMDASNCEAVWTVGLVHVEQETWTPAAAKFSGAMNCFASAAAQARTEIENTQRATYSETVKARRIGAAQKRVETSEHRKAQAAFNAAQSFLRLGLRAEALAHIDVAAEHPLLKEKAAALKPSIEKMPR